MSHTLCVDLYNDVVLLANAAGDVVDAFAVQGKTEHPLPAGVTHYTLRSLITLPGSCAVCGRSADQRGEHCTSSGGFHAFVGMDEDPSLAEEHKARARALAITRLNYDDLAFYIEQDNLFPITELLPTLTV